MVHRPPRWRSSGCPWLIGGAVVLLLADIGCGRKALPTPPVVRRAEATRDLAVVQIGDQAVLDWSFPSMTTAGGSLPDLESVEVWRVALPAAQEPIATGDRDRAARVSLLESQGERLAELGTDALAAATRGARLEYRDDLAAWWAAAAGSGGEPVLWYAVRSRCCGGRDSEFSNIARLRPEPPPPPPGELTAAVGEAGVELAWAPEPGLATIVERSENGTDWAAVTPEPVAGATFLDATAEQGRSWRYRVRSARSAAGSSPVVGPAGPEIEVDHVDRYPPAPPEEVVCLPEGQRIRIRWKLSPEVASYRVLRRRAGGAWLLLASDLASSEIADDGPPAGELSYGVEAVDAAGNASEPTICTAVMGPAP